MENLFKRTIILVERIGNFCFAVIIISAGIFFPIGGVLISDRFGFSPINVFLGLTIILGLFCVLSLIISLTNFQKLFSDFLCPPLLKLPLLIKSILISSRQKATGRIKSHQKSDGLKRVAKVLIITGLSSDDKKDISIMNYREKNRYEENERGNIR